MLPRAHRSSRPAHASPGAPSSVLTSGKKPHRRRFTAIRTRAYSYAGQPSRRYRHTSSSPYRRSRHRPPPGRAQRTTQSRRQCFAPPSFSWLCASAWCSSTRPLRRRRATATRRCNTTARASAARRCVHVTAPPTRPYRRRRSFRLVASRPWSRLSRFKVAPTPGWERFCLPNRHPMGRGFFCGAGSKPKMRFIRSLAAVSARIEPRRLTFPRSHRASDLISPTPPRSIARRTRVRPRV